MEQISDIHYTIFGLLAGCGWVSQSLLGLLDYSYSYRTRALKTLLDEQLIRKAAREETKHMHLRQKGGIF